MSRFVMDMSRFVTDMSRFVTAIPGRNGLILINRRVFNLEYSFFIGTKVWYIGVFIVKIMVLGVLV